MNKRKFFLLPICLLLLGACNTNTPSSKAKESEQPSSQEALPSSPVVSSEPEQSSSTPATSSEHVHSFGSWVTVKAPTCTETGLDERTCSCGEKETYVLDALGHDWDDGEVTTEPTEEAEGVFTYRCKRTGCTATKTESLPKIEGYDVTFVTSHCKIYIFDTQDYTATPTELPANGKTKSKDSSTGKASKYVAPNAEEGIAEIKPQVNFKVVCDNGYKVTEECITISGTKGTEWNNCKLQGSGIFRVTVIKADITITVTPVVDGGGQTIDAAVMTLVPTHCTIKVYIGPKNDAGTNVDEGPIFYSRSKTDPYDYLIGDNAQFNFEVVPENGYEFVDPTTYDASSEAKASAVTFITGSYNKLKLKATNVYNMTKVTGDCTITITCTPIA